jgi:hypothetical protein
MLAKCVVDRLDSKSFLNLLSNNFSTGEPQKIYALKRHSKSAKREKRLHSQETVPRGFSDLGLRKIFSFLSCISIPIAQNQSTSAFQRTRNKAVVFIGIA